MAKQTVSNTNVLPGVIEVTVKPDYIAFNKPEDKVEKRGKFKRSGHLTDQILTSPKIGQLSIWDSLQPQTKRWIESGGDIEGKSIVEGIRLSPAEQKVIDSLSKMLHYQSQNIDPESPAYYTGNAPAGVVPYPEIDNPSGQRTAPKLIFTLYELTKDYKGGDAIGGKDVENVKNVLLALSSRRYLIKYIETEHKKNGKKTVRKIETYSPLLQVVDISEVEYSREDVELSKKEETVIILNPIFRNQIDSKYILLPNDINKRTTEAYGSHNVSDATFRLREYLMRELSNKRFNPQIGLNKLYWTLCPKWMGESRKKKVKTYTEKALETMKALGLLQSYEVKTGSTGEPKIIFTLNKDWE